MKRSFFIVATLVGVTCLAGCGNEGLVGEVDDAAQAEDLDGRWQLVRGEDDYWLQLEIENGRVIRVLPGGPLHVENSTTIVDGETVILTFDQVAPGVDVRLHNSFEFTRQPDGTLEGPYSFTHFEGDQILAGPILARTGAVRVED